MERLVFPVTKKEAQKQGTVYSSEDNKNALFPSLLRMLRDKKGISQAKLAADLGVSKSTISLYETGDTLPDARTLRDIAVYFDVSTDYLVGITTAQTTDNDIKSICKKLKLRQQTVEAILRICRFPEDAFAFMLLVESAEFSEIVSLLHCFLSVHWSGKLDGNTLVDLDTMVREKTRGAARVVPAVLEKDLLLINAQRALEKAMERIDKQTLPPENQSSAVKFDGNPLED